jgi:hypothetical protein
MLAKYSESEVRNGLHEWLVQEVGIKPYMTMETVEKVLVFIEREHGSNTRNPVAGVEAGQDDSE